MKLTTDALRALKTSFNLKFTEAMTAAHAEAVHPEFCMDVGDADFSIVEIPFLEQFAFMREWIGDRKVKNLSEKVLRITEKPWEDTVAIGQRDLETGAWKQKGAVIAALGAGGEQLWDTLFIEAITNPGNWIDGKELGLKDLEKCRIELTEFSNKPINLTPTEVSSRYREVTLEELLEMLLDLSA